MRNSALAITTLAGLCGFALASIAPAQEANGETEPQLAITAVQVEPVLPAVDTLCRLRVEIENTGDRSASQLGFTVTINGQKLPVYENHLFMLPLPPGAKREVPLYNFWSTETSRPKPPGGKLEIEVLLREARWFEISRAEETETWTPLGDVPGLPVTGSVTVPMAKANAS